MDDMKGYFAVGAEGISKPRNLGAILRTAQAFRASFVFSVGAANKVRTAYSADTSKTFESVPYFAWDTPDEMRFPKGLQLVGVELTDDAVELPTFQHPRMAAYVFGRERGDLSGDMLARCRHVVKIPTKFCLNVSVAAALIMYDRMLNLGRWAERPIMPGGPKG